MIDEQRGPRRYYSHAVSLSCMYSLSALEVLTRCAYLGLVHSTRNLGAG